MSERNHYTKYMKSRVSCTPSAAWKLEVVLTVFPSNSGLFILFTLNAKSDNPENN